MRRAALNQRDLSAGAWLALLGAKFLWVLPFRTVLIVLLTLVSQILHLLAFLLPLKIVILLGSTGTPRYFPSVFAQLDRDSLIVVLGVATIGFFVAHKLAERLIDTVTRSAASFLVARNQKLVLFENQDRVAEGAYQGFARAFAGLAFCLLAIGALVWVYPAMALVMGGYIVISTALVLGGCAYSDRIQQWVVENLNDVTANLSAVGFFTVFGYLVLDFVMLQPPGILVAILAILAGRQSFGRVAAAVKGLYRLYRQRDKLNAIFFHGSPLVPVASEKPGSFWDFLAPGNRVRWIAPLLAEFCDSTDVDEATLEDEIKWQQLSVPNIAAFTCRTNEAVWFIKLFAKRGGAESSHEATLLADPPKGLPAPRFLGVSVIEGFYCSTYSLKFGKMLDSKQHRQARLDVLSILLGVEVKRSLVRQYLRSMPTLPKRINTVLLDRLVIAARSCEQVEWIVYIRRHWNDLVRILEELPLAIHNPAVNPGTIWQEDVSGELRVLQWERWKLEPTGAGWPVMGDQFQQLVRAYEKACVTRKSLRTCQPEHLMLAALTFELEQQLNKQKLDTGLELARRLWEILGPCLAGLARKSAPLSNSEGSGA